MRVRVQFPDVNGVEVEVVQKRLELLEISLPGATDYIHQMHTDRIPGRVHPGRKPVRKALALILDMHGAVEQRQPPEPFFAHGRRIEYCLISFRPRVCATVVAIILHRECLLLVFTGSSFGTVSRIHEGRLPIVRLQNNNVYTNLAPDTFLIASQ